MYVWETSGVGLRLKSFTHWAHYRQGTVQPKRTSTRALISVVAVPHDVLLTHPIVGQVCRESGVIDGSETQIGHSACQSTRPKMNKDMQGFCVNIFLSWNSHTFHIACHRKKKKQHTHMLVKHLLARFPFVPIFQDEKKKPWQNKLKPARATTFVLLVFAHRQLLAYFFPFMTNAQPHVYVFHAGRDFQVRSLNAKLRACSWAKVAEQYSTRFF